jgi:hypothetical protein
MISIYKSISQPFDKNYITVQQAIERIKNSRYKTQIEHLRTLTGDEFSKEKQKLPVYRWSGKFEYGNDKGLINHSGLICLDFDKFKSDNEMFELRKTLINDCYTHILFTSPSGKGLKVIVKITDNPENHRKHFLALEKHYNCEYWDSSSINISRACFDSYDPDIFYNQNSKVFDTIIEEVEEITSYVATIPIKSTNKIIQIIQKWFDAKYQLSEGNRNNAFFNLASAFNRAGINQNECESYILDNYSSVLDRDELLTCVKSGYRDKSLFGSAQFEDKEIINYVKKEIKEGVKPKIIKSKLKEYNDDEKEIILDKAESELKNFWRKDDKGKVSISPSLYRDFLSDNGFFKYYNSELSFIFIKIENNFVKEINEDIIKDFVLSYIEKQNDTAVFDYISSATKYFKKDFLNYMHSKDVKFIRDTSTKSFLFFENCVCEITKDEILEKQYVDFTEHVWEKQVIKRKFKTNDTDCDFEKFIKNISKTNDRYKSFLSVIGYMLHTHKNPFFSPAIILNDEDISDNPQGGTGKGLIVEALGKFKNVCTINGKNFDPSNQFAFQRISLDTQIVIFDDVQEHFDFEKLFSIITDGMPVNKKNKDEFFIEKDRTPKIIIPTNYIIKGAGSSHERRRFEIELHNYYNKSFTPYHEFKRNLFYDWDVEEWSKFDNFMLSCVRWYLINGLIEYTSVNIDEKRMMTDLGADFYSWINENIKYNTRIKSKDVFEEFVNLYPNYKKFSQKFTSQRMRKYGDYLLKKELITKFDTGKENGLPYFEFIKETI